MPKPVVYLLPGLMCDEAVWEHQARALAPHAEVRIPVFRGFDSLRAMAEYVLADAPEQFSVAGHSMGGRVALEVMALVLEQDGVFPQTEGQLNRSRDDRAGKRIEHFAVMDSGAHPVQDGERAKRQILLDAAARKGLQAVADAWILPMLHPQHHADKTLIDGITDMILRNSVEDYRGQVTALLGRRDQKRLLPLIPHNAWLFVGDADTWAPVSQHEDMQQLLHRSKLNVIPGAGHMSTMEQPDIVSNLLLEWINEPI